jgi:hypothetical protein
MTGNLMAFLVYSPDDRRSFLTVMIHQVFVQRERPDEEGCLNVVGLEYV